MHGTGYGTELYRMRAGTRVPRYQKFLQGALLLSALLLVLWLPPLVFSTGAPTYTTPGVTGLALNVSLAQVGSL